MGCCSRGPRLLGRYAMLLAVGYALGAYNGRETVVYVERQLTRQHGQTGFETASERMRAGDQPPPSRSPPVRGILLGRISPLPPPPPKAATEWFAVARSSTEGGGWAPSSAEQIMWKHGVLHAAPPLTAGERGDAQRDARYVAEMGVE
jgi:hypothetical protein